MASISKVILKDGKTVRYVVRYETITPDGRKKQLTKRFAKVKEAQDFLVSTVNAIKTGVYAIPEKITVAQWMDRWFAIHKPKIQPNTQVTYEENIRKIKEGSLGGILLQQLRAHHVDTFYTELAKTLSGSTILRVHANLHAALRVAVRDGLIALNPSDLIDLPKKSKFIPAHLSSDDVSTILHKFVENQERLVPIAIAADGGLRLSEVLGLKWSAIDFNTSTIRIELAVIRVKKTMVERRKLKDDASYRILHMPSTAMVLLKKQRM